MSSASTSSCGAGAAPAFPPAMCIRRNILHLLRQVSSRQGSKRCTPQSRWLERQGFGRIVGISYITSSSGKVRRCLISMMVAPASLRRCRLVGHLSALFNASCQARIIEPPCPLRAISSVDLASWIIPDGLDAMGMPIESSSPHKFFNDLRTRDEGRHRFDMSFRSVLRFALP